MRKKNLLVKVQITGTVCTCFREKLVTAERQFITDRVAKVIALKKKVLFFLFLFYSRLRSGSCNVIIGFTKIVRCKMERDEANEKNLMIFVSVFYLL